MGRLVLVDTHDALPGLLPLHGWSALMASDLVLVGSPEHPFVSHLDAADLAVEVVPEGLDSAPLGRTDLLGGTDPAVKARATWVVDRAEQHGEVTYLFGSGDAEAYTRVLGMEAANRGLEVEVVYFGIAPKGTRLLEFVAVEERLRGPGGCPWDREQTHSSLGRYAVEEVYELLEAIAAGNPAAICEELGDVLLQVVFHAQIAADEGTFDIDDVAGGIAEKLVRRHPHVFGDTEVADAGEVMRNWDQLKADEKPERNGPFDGVPLAQPALQLVEKLQNRAAKLGHDPADDAGLATDGHTVAEALEAFQEADEQARSDRLGDLLAAVVDLARRHGIDAESALRDSAHRFRMRVELAAADEG